MYYESRKNPENPKISFIIPFNNEEENVDFVLDELFAEDWVKEHKLEFIFVDDGSEDKTYELLKKWAEKDDRIKLIKLPKPRNGKSAALIAAFEIAEADWILLMDGDGQNIPSVYVKIIELLKSHKSVAGYREKRAAGFSRRIMSKFGNAIRKMRTKVPIKDAACIVMGFEKELIELLPKFEGMHRFIQTIFYWEGYNVVQISVPERVRQCGKSKYGINRLFKAWADLKGMLWFRKRMIKIKPEEIYTKNDK